MLFAGAVPDQFQVGASVIATGVLRDRETFDADTLTAQCPSRYEDEAPTESEIALDPQSCSSNADFNSSNHSPGSIRSILTDDQCESP